MGGASVFSLSLQVVAIQTAHCWHPTKTQRLQCCCPLLSGAPDEPALAVDGHRARPRLPSRCHHQRRRRGSGLHRWNGKDRGEGVWRRWRRSESGRTGEERKALGWSVEGSTSGNLAHHHRGRSPICQEQIRSVKAILWESCDARIRPRGDSEASEMRSG